MKLSQSFVAASLSVAAQSATARTNPESAKLDLLSSRAAELPLVGPKPARTVARGFGRRAPPLMFQATGDESPRATSRKSKRQAQRPPVNAAETGSIVSNVAEDLVGGLPVVGAPLSGALSSLQLPGENQPESAAPGTPSGLPAVGDTVAGILGSLPKDGITQFAVDQTTGELSGRRTPAGPLSGAVGGQVPDLLASAVGTLQGLPVVGDLARSLPLDSSRQSGPLTNVINTASGTIAGLPAVGAPLAQTLNSAASLAQALPLSLAAVPDSRSVSPNPYSYNQMSVTASMLGAAGGAFPIQPSHSLDGATLPNDFNPHSHLSSQAQFQTPDGILTPQSNHQTMTPSTNYPITDPPTPFTANSLPPKISFKEVYASADNFPSKNLRRRSTQLPILPGAGPLKFGFLSKLSAVHESKVAETSSNKEIPLIQTQKLSGSFRSWWKRRVFKISKDRQ